MNGIYPALFEFKSAPMFLGAGLFSNGLLWLGILNVTALRKGNSKVTRELLKI